MFIYRVQGTSSVFFPHRSQLELQEQQAQINAYRKRLHDIHNLLFVRQGEFWIANPNLTPAQRKQLIDEQSHIEMKLSNLQRSITQQKQNQVMGVPIAPVKPMPIRQELDYLLNQLREIENQKFIKFKGIRMVNPKLSPQEIERLRRERLSIQSKISELEKRLREEELQKHKQSVLPITRPQPSPPPRPQPIFPPRPQPVFPPRPQPVFPPRPQPVFPPRPQPVFSPRPRPGFPPRPQPYRHFGMRRRLLFQR